MSFIFGGDTGATYEQVQRRRQMAQQLMAQGAAGTPRNVGEGISSFAKSITGALVGRKAAKRDDELRAEANSQFEGVFGGMGGGSMPSYASPAPTGAPVTPAVTAPLPDTPQAVGNDAMAAIGREANTPPQVSTRAAVPAGLIQNESGGNPAALNDAMGANGIVGHGGRAQFGGARLQDAAAAGVIAPMSPQEFAQQPVEVQQAVEQWHFNDIDRQAASLGLNQYIGQTVGGVPITQDAIRSMAHLGGVGGVKRFLESGGQYNPADVNGSTLAEYGSRFGGGAASGSATRGQGGRPNVSTQQIVQLLSNPYIAQDPAKSAVLQGMLQQNMQGQDPMRQIELERAQLELQQLRSGGGADLPSGVVELQWRAEQAGLEPGTPEYQQFIQNGGGDPATFRALDMQAKAAGLEPGTPEYARFMETRGAFSQAFDREAGANTATAATGAAAAAATQEGQMAPVTAKEFGSSAALVASSIGNIDDAIAAIDSGANAGMIYNMLPKLDEASASLNNAMDRMGLDVIGSVTFGALSAAELRLAMETAAPRNLDPQELKTWLTRQRAAQAKAHQSLIEAAQHFANGGTQAEYYEMIGARGVGPGEDAGTPTDTPAPDGGSEATEGLTPDDMKWLEGN